MRALALYQLLLIAVSNLSPLCKLAVPWSQLCCSAWFMSLLLCKSSVLCVLWAPASLFWQPSAPDVSSQCELVLRISCC